MDNNYLFTEKDTTDIFSEDITVKRYKELQEKANDRFCYIIAQIAKIVGREVIWFDFDNEGGEFARGYFDKDLYSQEITFVGQSHPTRNTDFIHYDDCFPTKWLWTNFEKELEAEVSTFAEVEREKKEAEKNQDKEKQVAIDNFNEQLPKLKTAIYNKVAESILVNINFKTAERMHYETTFDKKNKQLEGIKDMINMQREVLRQNLTPEEFNAIEFKAPDKILHEMNALNSKKKIKIK